MSGMQRNTYLILTGCLGIGCLSEALAQDSLRSGLMPGQRPGPYAAVVCTGAERGKSHCYICETADRPAVIIFARTLSEPLGKLAHGLDKALGQYKAVEL